METTKLIHKKKFVAPKLRFKGFDDNWTLQKLSNFISFTSGYAFDSSEMQSEKGKYQLIKMSNVYKSELQLDRSPSYWGEIDAKLEKFLLKKKDILLTLTGTVGKMDYGYSVVIPEDNKFLINQRLVCLRFIPNISDGDFINNLIKTSRFYYLFFGESKGGTGNQTNVGSEDLKNIKLNIPSLTEQQKIAGFLLAVDEKIQLLNRKKQLLEQYKRGLLQQLFSGKLRFKDDNGKAYPKWEKRKMSSVLFEHKLKSTGKEEVFSVSVHKGLINQVEHLGRVFAAKNTDNYNLVKPHDVVYTKSPTGDFPLGIIKQSKLNKNVIISPLYGVFTPETPGLGYLLNVYFETPLNVTNYLASIIQKGAKNTINITNTTFLSKEMLLPLAKDEQNKIGNFLKELDNRINLLNLEISQSQTFKKGLLQQMFV